MSKKDKDYYSLISFLTNSISMTINDSIKTKVDWDKILNSKTQLTSMAFGIKAITDAAKSAVKSFNKTRKHGERFFNYSEDGKQFTVNEETFLKYVNERMPSAYVKLASFFFLVAAGESGYLIPKEVFHSMKQFALESDFNHSWTDALNSFIISQEGNVSIASDTFMKRFDTSLGK